MKQAIAVFLISVAALLIFTMAQPAQSQTVNTTTIETTLQYNLGLLSLLPPPTTTDPPGDFHHVQPADFDPGKTYLVQAMWLSGIGCPTNAFTLDFFTGMTTAFTDPACVMAPNDPHNKGLLLVKTGPTSNFAAWLFM